MLHKVFSPVICLCFLVWGTPGSGGQISGVMLVLRTFPELVGKSVQNLGGDWSDGLLVKEGYRYKQSLLQYR